MIASLYFLLIPLLGSIWIAQWTYMPLTLNVVWGGILFLIGWRHRQKHFTAVHKIILICFVLFSLILIYLNFKSFLGVDAGVALLTTCLFAKSLESKNTRDFLIIFNFGLFVSASLFLHSQSFLMLCMVLICLVFCFIGLYRIQTKNFKSEKTDQISLQHDIRHVLKLLMVAIPFFITLFIFFPRLPPLWHVPISANHAITGMSDQMSPGDIAQLSQSSALAFRVTGDLSQLPQPDHMYWRAMILDNYDGRVWTRSSHNQRPVDYHVPEIAGVKYQYLPATKDQPWIMSLESSISDDTAYQTYIDGSIKRKHLVQNNQPVTLYWLRSQKSIVDTNKQDLQQSLQINTGQEPKTQALAQQILKQSDADPARYVKNILDWYRQQDFIYTLSPEQLNGNRTDQFLFQTRNGFCEHYASSFVLLMRYAGIPARVVIGYQGGQLAPDAQSLEVRQLDAHAWAEVLIDDSWHRIDPTAAIAPARLEHGMQYYLQEDRRIWGSEQHLFWKQQNFHLIQSFRVWSDYLQYQWQSKVIGYNVDQQKSFFSKLGIRSVYSAIVIMLLSICGLVIVYGIYVAYKRRGQSSFIEYQISRFQRKMSPSMKKQKSETFKVWMLRLSAHANNKQPFTDVTKLYEKIHFLEQYSEKDFIKFKQLLKDCSFELNSVENTCHHK